MQERKTKVIDTQELIIQLTKLHTQALRFISEMKSGNAEKTCKEEELKEFEYLTSQLENYIEDVKDGTKPYTTYEEWCELLADTILDDDNFFIDKDGFLW